MLATLALPTIIGLISGTLITLFVVLTIAILLTASPAQAAPPPQINDVLWEDSLFVVTGIIQQVAVEEVPSNMGSDFQHHSVVEVQTVEKAEISPESYPIVGFSLPDVLPAPANQIDVYYWQAGQRPEGWTGPSGQYHVPSPKNTVRLFLTVAQGRFTLLEPNGWALLE